MSANQRRSGFRLPWLAESEETPEAQQPAEDAAPPSGQQAPAVRGTDPRADGAAPAPGASAGPASEDQTADAQAPAAKPGAAKPEDAKPEAVPSEGEAAAAPPQAPAAAPPEPPSEFMRELITAMRTVADEARHGGLEKLKADAEEAVHALEAGAEKRRQELRERAEADVNGVGEWARAEAERIKAEAEQRMAARRAQLEQQLAAEGTRAEAETKALRARVDDYERELEAYYAQLSEINDPAAFAAAAKRMPAPPALTPRPADVATAPTPAAAPEAAAAAAPHAAADQAAEATTGAEKGAPAAAAEAAAGTPDEVHPAEEEVLAARLAELDEKFQSGAATTAPADGAPVTTDVVVKGLGSFGAITGFRQSLSGQPGISAVALSLGQTGEFVFRATHAPDVDVAAAITALEGEGAKVEPRPEGGLRVTLERSR